MGTHPIFESDFDCLTDMIRINRSLGLSTTRQARVRDKKLYPTAQAAYKMPGAGVWGDQNKEEQLASTIRYWNSVKDVEGYGYVQGYHKALGSSSLTLSQTIELAAGRQQLGNQKKPRKEQNRLAHYHRMRPESKLEGMYGIENGYDVWARYAEQQEAMLEREGIDKLINREEEQWKLIRQAGNYNGWDGKFDIDSWLPEIFRIASVERLPRDRRGLVWFSVNFVIVKHNMETDPVFLAKVKKFEKKLGNKNLPLHVPGFKLPLRLQDPQLWVICAPNEVDEYRAVGAHKAGDSSILNGSVPNMVRNNKCDKIVCTQLGKVYVEQRKNLLAHLNELGCDVPQGHGMGKGARGTNVVKNAAEVGKMVKQAHMLRRTKEKNFPSVYKTQFQIPLGHTMDANGEEDVRHNLKCVEKHLFGAFYEAAVGPEDMTPFVKMDAKVVVPMLWEKFWPLTFKKPGRGFVRKSGSFESGFVWNNRVDLGRRSRQKKRSFGG